MLSVNEATKKIAESLAAYPIMPVEHVALAAAQGRTLAEAVTAPWSQPRAAVSAMDGYAVRAADTNPTTNANPNPNAPPTVPGQKLRVMGEIAAGRSPEGLPPLAPQQCYRIFTGSVVPAGADAILLQEDTHPSSGCDYPRAGGDSEAQSETGKTYIIAKQPVTPGRHIRPMGLDYQHGQILLSPGRRLSARDLALAASANYATLAVRMKPRVGILATGDEILRLGQTPALGKIIGGNGYYLAGLIAAAGGEPVMLDIASDHSDHLQAIAAAARQVDLMVTTGGASVGDYDLVKSALGQSGLALEFWKMAMRPGKPIIFGRYQNIPFFGLPGNPVSTAVCGLLFVWPTLQYLLGREFAPHPTQPIALAYPLAANDQRQDYLRARLVATAKGEKRVECFDRQDSSMMTFLAAADGLVIRPPLAAAAAAGSLVEFLPFPIGV
ncbi:MAG: molybdopterin molybdotransferase MoeA [Candidatus Symbiobacter sp.]|nr:molybdopterin molybdotransferase MoeA [Candidatus Symbiobacter sp.]